MLGRVGRPVSLEVPVLQVAVLEGEAFLLPLAPLLVVEVDVGALRGGGVSEGERCWGAGPSGQGGLLSLRPARSSW